MTPLNTNLYGDFINPDRTQTTRKINLTVMKGSYFDGKRTNEISLPNNCKILAAYRFDGILYPQGNYELKDEDQVEIELEVSEVEKLHEFLNGMATVYKKKRDGSRNPSPLFP